MSVELDPNWMPLEKYVEITKESRNVVHVRVATGVWQRGKHISTPDGGKTFVNIPAIIEWCQTAFKASPGAQRGLR